MNIPNLYTLDKIESDEYLVLNNVLYKFGRGNQPSNGNHLFCFGSKIPVISSQPVGDLEQEYFRDNKQVFLAYVESKLSDLGKEARSRDMVTDKVAHFKFFKMFIEDVVSQFEALEGYQILDYQKSAQTPAQKKPKRVDRDPGREYDSSFLSRGRQEMLVAYPNILKFDLEFYNIIEGRNRDFFFHIGDRDFVLGDAFSGIWQLKQQAQQAIIAKMDDFTRGFTDYFEQLKKEEAILKHVKKGSYFNDQHKIGFEKSKEGNGFRLYYYQDKPFAILDDEQPRNGNYYVFPPAHIYFEVINANGNYGVDWGSGKPFKVLEPYIFPALVGDQYTANKTYCTGDPWQEEHLARMQRDSSLSSQVAELLYWAKSFLTKNYKGGGKAYAKLSDSRFRDFGPRTKDEIISQGVECRNDR